MEIPFYKYQGTGNDFVIIDNRAHPYVSLTDHKLVERLCDRKFGVGADGLMLLQNNPDYDFEMVYFNADGYEGSMCGNGGRCIVAFAHFLGAIGEECRFIAVDGPHDAKVLSDGWVELKMVDVAEVEEGEGFYFLDTGSPHYVAFAPDVAEIDVVEQGRAIRYSERFKAEATNVNFVQADANQLIVATYERGVEDETLSCGTGVTAAALAASLQSGQANEKEGITDIQAKGGKLQIKFTKTDNGFENVWLCGPATQVFQGTISIEA